VFILKDWWADFSFKNWWANLNRHNVENYYVPPPPPPPKEEVGMSKEQVFWKQLAEKGCPDCHTFPMKYYEGPCGGLMMNIECECGSRFNVSHELGIAERI
jgi:hypothetical protein